MEKKCKIALVAVCLLAVGWLCLSGQQFQRKPVLAKSSISAELKAIPESYSGACPTTITFRGKITVTAPMTVKYKFIRSDGAIAPEQTLVFSAPGSKAVSTSWTLGKTFSGWQAIQIISPEALKSNQASFSINCTPKPLISSLTYFHYGMPTAHINLKGTDFGAVQGSRTILVDGNPVTLLSWTDTTLSFSHGNLIPWEHTYKYWIQDGGAVISNVFEKRYFYRIAQFTPTGGAAPGAEFTVNVWNLPTAPGGLEVRLGTHICPVVSWSGGPGGTIKVRVPAGLSPGTYPLALWKGGVKVSIPETMNFNVL